jgi:hypothetical protein
MSRLEAFGTLLNLEFNFLALLERPVSFHFNGRKMYEDIISIIVVTANEAVTFGRIEPFYGSNKTIRHPFTLHLVLNSTTQSHQQTLLQMPMRARA